MNLQKSQQHGFTILSLQGQIGSLKDSIALKSEINSLLEERTPKIALCLKDLEYVDSAALNVLIYARNQIEKYQGLLCLLEPNEYIMDMISVVGLRNVFTICMDRDSLKTVTHTPLP